MKYWSEKRRKTMYGKPRGATVPQDPESFLLFVAFL